MNLSIKITGRRRKANTYGRRLAADFEDYDHVTIESADGNRAVIAGCLRAIADDLDPLLPGMDAIEFNPEVSS